METTPDSRLFEYGIHTEGSDWRAHVAPLGRGWWRAVYFFPTAAGIVAAKRYAHRAYHAGQRGVDGPTGRGPRVFAHELSECHLCHPLGWMWDTENWSALRESEEKARAAERFVALILREGWVPTAVPFCSVDLSDIVFRYTGSSGAGYDFLIRRISTNKSWRLEVKADYPASRDGVFLQTHERNPLSRH